MPEYIRAYTERADDSRPGDAIRFIASTSDVVRDGMIVEAAGWQLDNFKRNPVFLWAHNYFEPPIGTVKSIAIDGDNLIADVVFDQDDPEALRIERKYRNGILNAVSVGFNVIDYQPSQGQDAPRATKAELLEISGVPVPADPNALAERQRKLFRSLALELAAIPDDDSPAPDAEQSARPSWEEASAAMVDLFQPYGPRSDDDRRAAYDRLARDYARHKRTPPEFATAAELQAFDDDTLRGRFLEGEPDLHADRFIELSNRAGAVLSRKNREDLAQAITLINSVLDRAKKEPEESDDDERTFDEMKWRTALGLTA
jgi:HK97 family phage prohead protease